MPLMQLKMLVLPAPLGPMMAKKSPAATSRLTPARATTPPKLRCRPSRASSAIPAKRSPGLAEAPRRRQHRSQGAPEVSKCCARTRPRACALRRRDDHVTSGADANVPRGELSSRRGRVPDEDFPFAPARRVAQVPVIGSVVPGMGNREAERVQALGVETRKVG